MVQLVGKLRIIVDEPEKAFVRMIVGHEPRLPRSSTVSKSQNGVKAQSPRQDAVLPSSLAPRGLARDQAAAYIGLGTTKFDQLVADGRMPKPIRIEGAVRWDRWKVDEAFSALSERVDANPFDELIVRSGA